MQYGAAQFTVTADLAGNEVRCNRWRTWQAFPERCWGRYAYPPGVASAGMAKVAFQPQLDVMGGELPGRIAVVDFQQPGQDQGETDPASGDQQAAAAAMANDGVHAALGLPGQVQNLGSMKAVMFDSHFASVFRVGRNTYRVGAPNWPAATSDCAENIA